MQIMKRISKRTDFPAFKVNITGKGVAEGILTAGFLTALSLIILMQSPLNCWKSGRVLTDSAVYKYVALVMSEGGMPYKDVFDHKGPLLYIYNYIGSSISYYQGVWFIELFSMVLFLYFTYKMAHLFCGKAISCFCTAVAVAPLYTYLEGGNHVEEYALPFIAISLFIFADYFLNNRVTTFRLIIMGVSFGAVLMLRANMISVWIVFCIAVLIQGIRYRSSVWKYLLWFVAGAAIILIPLLVWLVHGGAFSNFVNDYILFNLKYSSAGLSQEYEVIMYFLSCELVLVSIVAVVYLIGYKINIFWNLTYLIYIIVTMYLLSISGRTYGHYGMLLVPMFIYPLSSTCHLLCQNKDHAILVYLTAIVLVIFPTWKAYLDLSAYKLVHPDDDIISGQEETICQIAADNTSENEKIIVIGNDNFYYIYLHKLATSRYSYQLPISEVDYTIAEEFAADLVNEKPKIVIVQDDTEEYTKLFTTIDNYDLLFTSDEGTAIYKIKQN